MSKLRVLEAFSGYGSQSIALENLGIPHEVVATSEIEEDAIIAYAAIRHDLNKVEVPSREEMVEFLKPLNIAYDFKKGKSKLDRMKLDKLTKLYQATKLQNCVGDISLIEPNKLPDHDLFTYSFPCQDLSVAGKGQGMVRGATRSGLLYECEKVIEVKRPKYLLLENVKNLVGKKFKEQFDEWLDYLSSLGYTNYWQVLNAKEHGVPQNRERVFVISILGEHEPYKLPEKQPLTLRLKDLLESQVDEKYYLSQEIQERFKFKQPSQKSDIKIIGTTAPECRTIGQRDECFSTDGIVGSLIATDYKQPKQIVEFMGIGHHPTSKKLEFNGWHDKESPCLIATDYKAPKTVLEKVTSIENGAIRGRYTEDGSIQQELELREDGCTNTITTVQKDNVLRIGGLYDTETTQKQAGAIYDKEGISRTLMSSGGNLDDKTGRYLIEEPLLIKEATKKGFKEAYEGDSVNLEQPNSKTRRGRVGNQMANTLTTSCNQGAVVDYRIRRLTPRECWRLMGVDDVSFDRVVAVGLSDSALYRLAGNSIVVDCLEGLFSQLFKAE